MTNTHIHTLPRDTRYSVDDIVDALERYLNQGIMPGGFLTAVLENNLTNAFGRADEKNTNRMRDIVRYMYNHFPEYAWGSRAKVGDFLTRFEKRQA